MATDGSTLRSDRAAFHPGSDAAVASDPPCRRISSPRTAGTRRRGLNGERLAEHFGVRATSTITVQRPGSSAMTVTRLEGHVRDDATTPALRPEAAYSIVLQMGDLEHHTLHVAGHLVHSGQVPAGAVSVVSLEDSPRSSMRGFFDAIQFYVPYRLFDELADEDGLRRPGRLSWPRAERDPTAETLGHLLAAAMREPDPAKSMFVEHVTLALVTHSALRYGQDRADAAVPSRSGLAPWQERRAKDVMGARFAAALTMTEVARACKLSPSYFAAAFRRSTGSPPHRYLSGLRVSEAKRLMLTTELSLADIALLCGFSDQSYFTRVFSNLVGRSPGQWRRLHRENEPCLA